jgi:hypothetical protein
MARIHGNPEIIPSSDTLSRRSAAGGLLAGGLAFALLATTDRHGTLAQATPAAGNEGPVRYTLNGDDIALVFAPAGVAGAARLDYRDAKGSRSFTGPDLTVEHSETLGRFVSALIDFVSDGYDRYLTLLVPAVNPIEDQNDVPIQTVAIMTTYRTSIGGPALVKGALQTYEVVVLEGVATFGAT